MNPDGIETAPSPFPSPPRRGRGCRRRERGSVHWRTRGFRWMRSGPPLPALSSRGGEGVRAEFVVGARCASRIAALLATATSRTTRSPSLLWRRGLGRGGRDAEKPLLSWCAFAFAPLPMNPDGPLSLSLSPSKGERVPKAGEGCVQLEDSWIPLDAKSASSPRPLLQRRRGRSGRIRGGGEIRRSDRGASCQLPPADDSNSLSSFGGEGWGEEAVMPRSRSCLGVPSRVTPPHEPRWPPLPFTLPLERGEGAEGGRGVRCTGGLVDSVGCEAGLLSPALSSRGGEGVRPNSWRGQVCAARIAALLATTPTRCRVFPSPRLRGEGQGEGLVHWRTRGFRWMRSRPPLPALSSRGGERVRPNSWWEQDAPLESRCLNTGLQCPTRGAYSWTVVQTRDPEVSMKTIAFKRRDTGQTSFALRQPEPAMSNSQPLDEPGRSLPDCSRAAFTLIELLVVIAIIAILAALLLSGVVQSPGTGPARRQPEQHQADRAGRPPLCR